MVEVWEGKERRKGGRANTTKQGGREGKEGKVWIEEEGGARRERKGGKGRDRERGSDRGREGG